MNTPQYLAGAILKKAKRNIGKIFREAGLSMDRAGSRMSNDVAYLEQISRHRQRLPMYDLVPNVSNSWVAPNATLVGEVHVSPYATIWYNVVVRGEINAVRIGVFSSIGDNTVIHTAASLPTGLPASVNIGKNVTIHNNCSLYSCVIDDDVVVGAKSIILEGARLERGCQIGANSVVPPGRLIPANQLWAGNPVEFVKELDIGELWANYSLSYVNTALGDMTKAEFTLWPSNYLQKQTVKDDAEPDYQETVDSYVTKNYYRGKPRYFS